MRINNKISPFKAFKNFHALILYQIALKMLGRNLLKGAPFWGVPTHHFECCNNVDLIRVDLV